MKRIMLIILLTFPWTSTARELPVERGVDVNRYVGTWYAHYALPQFFTRGCRAQTAQYKTINDLNISVVNTCIKKRSTTRIRGQARVTNPGDNSRLVVRFNNFFTRLFRVKGDYNIIKLDPNYEYVIVGSKNRKSLWLMSRSEDPWPDSVKQEYFDYAHSLGFKTNKLVKSKF